MLPRIHKPKMIWENKQSSSEAKVKRHQSLPNPSSTPQMVPLSIYEKLQVQLIETMETLAERDSEVALLNSQIRLQAMNASVFASKIETLEDSIKGKDDEIAALKKELSLLRKSKPDDDVNNKADDKTEETVVNGPVTHATEKKSKKLSKSKTKQSGSSSTGRKKKNKSVKSDDDKDEEIIKSKPCSDTEAGSVKHKKKGNHRRRSLRRSLSESRKKKKKKPAKRKTLQNHALFISKSLSSMREDESLVSSASQESSTSDIVGPPPSSSSQDVTKKRSPLHVPTPQKLLPDIIQRDCALLDTPAVPDSETGTQMHKRFMLASTHSAMTESMIDDCMSSKHGLRARIAREQELAEKMYGMKLKDDSQINEMEPKDYGHIYEADLKEDGEEGDIVMAAGDDTIQSAISRGKMSNRLFGKDSSARRRTQRFWNFNPPVSSPHHADKPIVDPAMFELPDDVSDLTGTYRSERSVSLWTPSPNVKRKKEVVMSDLEKDAFEFGEILGGDQQIKPMRRSSLRRLLPTKVIDEHSQEESTEEEEVVADEGNDDEPVIRQETLEDDSIASTSMSC